MRDIVDDCLTVLYHILTRESLTLGTPGDNSRATLADEKHEKHGLTSPPTRRDTCCKYELNIAAIEFPEASTRLQ